MYFLRRLKRLGATEETLKEVYILFIRSLLEFAAPLWAGALTGNKKLTNQLDKIHNYACRIIKPQLSPIEAQTEFLRKLED